MPYLKISFTKSVSSVIILLSHGLKTVEIFSNISCNSWVRIKMWQNLGKDVKCTVRKIFRVLFGTFVQCIFCNSIKTFFCYTKMTWLNWNWFFSFSQCKGWKYSSTVKNWQKWSSVHHHVGIKELNMKYMYMKNRKIWNSACFFTTKTDQFLTVYSLYC